MFARVTFGLLPRLTPFRDNRNDAWDARDVAGECNGKKVTTRGWNRARDSGSVDDDSDRAAPTRAIEVILVSYPDDSGGE
jgi:hypothetical protein